MSEVVTYSPSDVTITFGGYTLQGWDSISIRRQLPSFRQVNGIRGKNSRIRVRNTAAEILIELPQTSEANYVFQKIVELDEQIGTGRIAITVKDALGSEVFSSSDAFIEGPADRQYNDSISGRTWKINCLTSTYSASESQWSLESIFSSIFN